MRPLNSNPTSQTEIFPDSSSKGAQLRTLLSANSYNSGGYASEASQLIPKILVDGNRVFKDFNNGPLSQVSYLQRNHSGVGQIPPKDSQNSELAKAKKKTVVEMLTTESCCLPNMPKDLIKKLIEESQILEEDRKRYLTLELPKASLGLIDMSKAEEMLSNSKTLLFFLGPFIYSGERGTIMVIVESQSHIIYVIFLRREITRTIRNESGVFSFQFGPHKDFKLADRISSNRGGAGGSGVYELQRTVPQQLQISNQTPNLRTISPNSFKLTLENNSHLKKTPTTLKEPLQPPLAVETPNPVALTQQPSASKLPRLVKSTSRAPSTTFGNLTSTSDNKVSLGKGVGVGVVAPKQINTVDDDSFKVDEEPIDLQGDSPSVRKIVGLVSPEDLNKPIASPSPPQSLLNNPSERISITARLNPIPTKRHLSQNYEYDKVGNLDSPRSTTESSVIEPKKPNTNTNTNAKSVDVLALMKELESLKKQIQVLQVAFFTSTKSLLAAGEVSKSSKEATHREQLKILQDENDTLKRTIKVLLSQNKLLTIKNRMRSSLDADVEIPLSPPHVARPSQVRNASTNESPKNTPWSCKWSGCMEKEADKGSLWNHILKKHIRSQSDSAG